MPRWAPNALTCLRLLLAPFVIQAIWKGHAAAALVLFACAAATDGLDGFIARRFELASARGAYLDPIADKILLSGVYLALAASGSVPWWLVGLIFGRDVYILLGASLFLRFTPMRKFPPSSWGKTSTFLQVVTAVLWMARNWLGGPVLYALAIAFLWPCAAFTLASGLHYTWRGIQLAREH